jgi:hypothetical protein
LDNHEEDDFPSAYELARGECEPVIQTAATVALIELSRILAAYRKR